MRELFWGSALFIAYVYVGYGVLLVIWARARKARPTRTRLRKVGHASPAADLQLRSNASDCDLPLVSIIIAARNEARRLPARIDNLFALDYPADRRQVIVVSDGSSDDTASAVARFGDRVRLVEIPPAGK